MKIRFYCDVYVGAEIKYLSAHSQMTRDPSNSVRRFAFDVEIPDDAFTGGKGAERLGQAVVTEQAFPTSDV